jgi:Sec-independent protein translocase protein TatA
VEGTKACLLRRFIRRFRCTTQERAQEGEDEKEEAKEGEEQEGEAQEAEARRS